MVTPIQMHKQDFFLQRESDNETLPPLFPTAMLMNLSCILSALGLMSKHGLLPIPIVANSDKRFSEK